MQVRDRVGVAGVEFRLDREDAGIEILPVRQLRFIERQVHARLDLAAEEIGGCTDHVVTRVARQQAGLHRLLGIIDVVDDLDTGELLELRNGVRADEVGPVVHVQPLLFGPRGQAGSGHAQQHRNEESLNL